MPTELDLAAMLHYVETTARTAGEMLREANAQPRQVHYKGVTNLVTQTDIDTEAAIVAALRQAYPEIGLLAEEGGSTGPDGDLYWVIDPLDGTNNFAHGHPNFTVSIALRDADGPLLGVVLDPLRSEVFSAARGEGALLNGTPIHVSETDHLQQALLATGFPYERGEEIADINIASAGRFLRAAQGLRRSGTAALDLAYVACGRMDGYWEMRVNPWDVDAGILLVNEAGGQVSDYQGRPDSRIALDGYHLIASNGRIHPEMVEVLADLYAFDSEGQAHLKEA
jgi:myo-inositol-1(or 4)-monophosphatase